MSTPTTPSKVDPTKIILEGIGIMRAAIDPTDDYIAAPVEPVTTTWNCTTAWNVDHKTSAIMFSLRVDLKGLDKKSKEIGLNGYYELGFRFKVVNLKELTQKTKDGDAVDMHLLATIAGIAYSTTRGIVMDRTAGTYFNGVILPVIDPKQLLQNVPVVPAPKI